MSKSTTVSPSPLHQLRERLGLTVTEIAATVGVTYQVWYNSEKGTANLPGKACAALAEVGVDVDQLRRDNAAWMDERARAKRAELRERLAVAQA